MARVTVNNANVISVKDMKVGDIGIIEKDGLVILRTREYGVILTSGAVIDLDPETSPNLVRVLQRGESVTLAVDTTEF